MGKRTVIHILFPFRVLAVTLVPLDLFPERFHIISIHDGRCHEVIRFLPSQPFCRGAVRMDMLKIIPDGIFDQIPDFIITAVGTAKLSGPLHRTADLTAPQIQNLRLFLPCFLQKFHLYIAAREIGELRFKTFRPPGKSLLAPGICHGMEGLSFFPVLRTLETKFLAAGSLHPKLKKESHILAKIIDQASIRLLCCQFSFISPDNFNRSIKHRLQRPKLRTLFQKCSLRQLFFLFR